MRTAEGWTGRHIGLSIAAAFPILMHVTLLWAPSSMLATVLVWLALALVALVAIIRFNRRIAFLTLGLVVAAALGIGTTTSDAVVAVSGIPHAVAYTSLLAVFGSSLLRGRTPVVSLLSERLSGRPLSPEMGRYTRAVTAAWCCFFLFQLAGSLVLLLAAPVAAWSLFVNILNIPLNLGMFGVEYAYRRFRFRDYRHG